MATTTRAMIPAGPPVTTMSRLLTAVSGLARLATRFWSRLGLAAVLSLAAALNCWALDRLGYANSYYAAAVKSMLQSWHNFFFVSFDPGGFVTIDKPPLGFWIETASARLFGYSGVSILLPEALAGVLSVAVLYRLVGYVWGRGAGLLAALFLALTPISVVTSRNNTIDSLLVLTVLLAAWAVARAAETGRLRPLLLCAVLVGLGFNIKMLEAYLVVPAFGLVYLLGALASWRRRLGHLVLAAGVLLVVSLSWATAVDLTPANVRPYVGSSGTNSELNLALGYNGLQRLTGMLVGRAAGGAAGGTTGGTSGAGNALFNGGPAGLFRLLGATLGCQVSWLLALAVLGLVAAATRVPWRHMDGRGRALVLWGTWLITAGAFFSVAEFFHPYYTVMLAPAIAALAAIGVATLWQAYRRGGWRGWLLPPILLVTAAVQAYILRDYPDWSRWLTPLVVGASLLAAAILVATMLRRRRGARVALVATGVAVATLLVAPATWAAYSVAYQANATIPTAGPAAPSAGGAGAFGPGAPGSGMTGRPSGAPGSAPAGAPGSGANGGPGGSANGGPGGSAPGSQRSGMGVQVDITLIRYLEAHQGTAAYLVATASSQSASSIIIATGKPVMALGGFSGSDQILTTGQLATLVKKGTVRYFLVQSGGPAMGGVPPERVLADLPASVRAGIAQNGVAGGAGSNSALLQWVTRTCTAVPSSRWQTTSTTVGGGAGTGTLYDCGSAATGGR